MSFRVGKSRGQFDGRSRLMGGLLAALGMASVFLLTPQTAVAQVQQDASSQFSSKGRDLSACIAHRSFTMTDGTAAQSWTNNCGVNVYYEIFMGGRRVDGGQMPAEDHNPRVANAGAVAKFEAAN